MKIEKQSKKGYVVSLKVSETQEGMPDAMERAFLKYRKNVKIQGFRKGKVSRAVFEKAYGTEVLIQEAVDDLVNKAYGQAVKELDLKIVDYPKNLNVEPYDENKDIVFSCEVDVEPEGKLGKYKGLKLKKEDESVSKDDEEAVMNQALDRFASYESTDKAAKEGAILRLKMKAAIVTERDGKEEKEPYEPWCKESSGLRLGAALYGKELDDQLLGLKKGDKKEIAVSYDDSFHIEDLKGKSLSFDVEIDDVRQKTLPELTDEWVEKNIKEEGVKTAKTYKENLVKGLHEQKKESVKRNYEQAAIDAALEKFEIDLPSGVVEREMDQSVYYFANELKRMGFGLDQYLKQQNMDPKAFRENYRESATKSVKTRKLLEAVVAKEKISVDDDALDSLVKSWNDPKLLSLDDVRKDPNMDVEYLRKSHSQQRALEFLVSSAKIS